MSPARAPRPSSPPWAATLLALTLGALVVVAAVPAWRALTAPLLGLLGLSLLGLALNAPPPPEVPVPPDDYAALTPQEFERRVARLLAALPGWQAEVTRSGADQGADVLATGPGGVRVAVQVKRYRSAVGNKAVQQIVASKAFYGCAHAIVATSGPGYTRAAQELARANGVKLWTVTELTELRTCVEQRRPPPPGLLLDIPGRDRPPLPAERRPAEAPAESSRKAR